jgi:hypothetical protein
MVSAKALHGSVLYASHNISAICGRKLLGNSYMKQGKDAIGTGE